MDKENLNKKTLKYLKDNKENFIANYLKNAKIINSKIAIFTAGASGAGKTEYAISRKEKEPYLIHIDTDEIRNFFIPIGYNGNNANLFQQASSKGVDILYKEAINKGYSVILDTNFSNLNIASINLTKSLKHQYIIEIVYILQDLDKCLEFAKVREKVTKRVVPKEVIENSFINSINTVIQIKEFFKDRIILNLIDRIDNKFYENITANEFFEKIPNDLKEML
jgi:predicted kinase